MKKIIRKILKEDIEEQFLNKIILLMKDEYPLFKKLDDYGFNLSEEEMNYVFSGIFGEPVIKQGFLDEIPQRSASSIEIYNQNGDEVYSEDSYGFWEKQEYDENGNKIYVEDSDGGWEKYEFDDNGKDIYYENSDGDWIKYRYDENGNQTYYESSNGEIYNYG